MLIVIDYKLIVIGNWLIVNDWNWFNADV